MTGISTRLATAAIEAAKEPHRLLHGELLAELRFLKLNAEQVSELPLIGGPSAAEHEDVSRVRCQQTLTDLDRRRLARTVGAEETEAFARPDLEVEARHRHDIAVAFVKPSNGERRCRGR